MADTLSSRHAGHCRAHRDDIEQTCGGTLLKMAERGYRTAVLDLTQGEMGTRGTPWKTARERPTKLRAF